MNGLNGIAAHALWQEARNPEGRVYYYNTQTKATQWTKPLELMTPAERALSDQPWKEYTAEGGRKYWYNTETKQSSWEIPQVYKEALAQTQSPLRPVPQAPTFVAGGSSSFPQHQSQSAPLGQDRQIGYGNGEGSGPRGYEPTIAPTVQPDYSSLEEAEAAFMKLLKRAGVQPDWTWEQTMKATIRDPQYRALKDPKDRKVAFEKYSVEVRMQEKDRAKERLAKLRADFGTMLRSHPEIKHYTRWKTARPIIEGETIFRSTDDENERRQLFEEYIIDLKKANVEREASTRKAAMDDLVALLKSLDLEPYTRWSEAQGIIQSNERFQGDKKFTYLSKSDILTAFENHIKALERSFNDARQQQKNTKARRERQNRDNFLSLLRELKAAGKIKAGTKWMQIHPVLESDQRYVAMLGQSGSTPLDLFWDMIEEEERGLRGKRNDIIDILEDKRQEVLRSTTFDEFMGWVRGDPRIANVDRDIIQHIFDRLRDKAIRRSDEARHGSERSHHKAVDALRSHLRHLSPPITSTATWEEVRARVEKTSEYREVPTDDLRRSTFEKVLRRVREKEEDAEREKNRGASSHRDRSMLDAGRSSSHRDRERERDRDRDRDGRNGPYTSSRRHVSHRFSRSPEPDAYEADRKKAQADRERQYRKGSTGLSPPPRSSRDKERDRDRGGRVRSPGRYERNRRDLDDNRDRDRRGRRERGSDELDYGEAKGSAEKDKDRERKRRGRSGSETSVTIGRESKRSRRDRSRDRSPGLRRHKPSRSPQPAKVEAPEPVMHSGSEEGEIEEE